jgi:hypothetical protein
VRSGGVFFFRAGDGGAGEAGPKRGRLFPLMGMAALLLGGAERSTPEAPKGGTPLGVPGLTAKARAKRQWLSPTMGRHRWRCARHRCRPPAQVRFLGLVFDRFRLDEWA